MKHRIRAAGIAVDGDKVLLIKHVHGNQAYWIPPGGGLEPQDGSTRETVRREVFEESGLNAEIGPLLFIREFYEKSQNTYHVEQFYLINSWEGELHLKNLSGLGGDENIIKKAKWMGREEMSQEIVYPEELRTLLWQQIEEPNITPVHLGVQTEEI